MTPETRDILERALAKLHDNLRFGMDMREFPKHHHLRARTAELLWNLRSARRELGIPR